MPPKHRAGGGSAPPRFAPARVARVRPVATVPRPRRASARNCGARRPRHVADLRGGCAGRGCAGSAAVYRLIARVRSRQLSSRAATGGRRRGGRERGGPGLGGLVQIGLEFRCIRSRRRSNPCGTPGGVCPSTLAGPLRPPSLGEDRSLPSDDRGDAAPGTEPASGSRLNCKYR
jgi:hypothetical protein